MKMPRYNNTSQELLAKAESGRYIARNSGAEFPPGLRTHTGRCEICTRENTPVVRASMTLKSGVVLYTHTMCSECFYDAIAATMLFEATVVVDRREFSAYAGEEERNE